MSTAFAKSVREIANDTLRLCQDYRGDGVDGKVWTWAEVMECLKLTVHSFVAESGILKAIRSIKIEPDVYVYSLPTDCIRMLRASMNGLDGAVIMPKSVGAQDYTGDIISLTEGDPLFFFRDILNPNQIGFVPVPIVRGSETDRSEFVSRVYNVILSRDPGVLRGVYDGSEYMPVDGDNPIRWIDPAALSDTPATGDGIISDLSSGTTDTAEPSDVGIIRRISDDDGNRMPFDGNNSLRDIRKVPFVRSGIGEIIRDVLCPDGNIQITYIRTPYFPEDSREFIDSDIPEYLHGAFKYSVAAMLLNPVNRNRADWFRMKWQRAVERVRRNCEHKGGLDSAKPV